MALRLVNNTLENSSYYKQKDNNDSLTEQFIVKRTEISDIIYFSDEHILLNSSHQFLVNLILK